MNATWKSLCKARREQSRRAFSLLELMTVVAIIGLMALAGISRFGNTTLSNSSADGFARKLSLSLAHARRATISTGDNHYVQLAPASGVITNFAIIRKASGGDVQVDQSHAVPQDVTVSSATRTLEFDFDGTALAAYTISITAPERSWDVTVVQLTGSIAVTETTP